MNVNSFILFVDGHTFLCLQSGKCKSFWHELHWRTGHDRLLVDTLDQNQMVSHWSVAQGDLFNHFFFCFFYFLPFLIRLHDIILFSFFFFYFTIRWQIFQKWLMGVTLTHHLNLGRTQWFITFFMVFFSVFNAFSQFHFLLLSYHENS